MSLPPDDPMRFARLCLERGAIDRPSYDRISVAVAADPACDVPALLVGCGVPWEDLEAIGAVVDLGGPAAPASPTAAPPGPEPVPTAAQAPGGPGGRRRVRWRAWLPRLAMLGCLAACGLGWWSESRRSARVEGELRATAARAEAAEKEIRESQRTAREAILGLTKSVEAPSPWHALPQAPAVRYAMAERVLAYYEQERARRPMDLALKLAAARSRLAYARCHTQLGPVAKQQAKAEFQKAIDLFEQIMASFNDLEARDDLGQTLFEAGMFLKSEGQELAALPFFARGFTVDDALRRDSPNRNPSEVRLLKTLPHLARIQAQLQRYADAEKAFERLLELMKEGRVTGIVAGSPIDLKLLLETESNLADVQQRLRKPNAALHTLKEAVRDYDAIIKQFPKVPEYRHGLAMALIKLAPFEAQGEDPKDAIRGVDRAIAILEDLLEQNPGASLFASQLADALITRLSLPGPDDPTTREFTLSRAAEIYEKLVRDRPGMLKYRQELAIRREALGRFYAGRNTLDAAERAWTRAVEVRGELLTLFPREPARQAELADALIERGAVKKGLDRRDEAALDWKRAGELFQGILKNPAADQELRMKANGRIQSTATLLQDAGRDEDARSLLGTAPDVDRKILQKDGKSPSPDR